MRDAVDAAIAGAYEHPTREAPDRSTAELHADVATGALADAGLEPDDVDGYATAGTPGWIMSMADYLGLIDLAWYDYTDAGGSSYVSHVGHAAAAIAAGKCEVVLVTLAGRPRSEPPLPRGEPPEFGFENVFGRSTVGEYALAARRHMHEFGTTHEQLAAVRVAASEHARHNEHAMFPEPVTIEDVLDSRPIADPLHLLDCCVISDGGGAVVVVSPERATELDRECPVVLGHGEAIQGTDGALPFNTDGGGLCNNHPGNRGGMTKMIEAVRQLRGEANEPVQVPDCELAIAHGTGGSIGTRHSSSTLVLGAAR